MPTIDFPDVKVLIQEVRASPMSKVIRIGTMDSKVALFLNEEDFTLFQELRDFAHNKGKVEEAIMGYLDRPGSDAVVRMVFNQPGEAIIKYDITERPTGTKLGVKDGRKYAAKVRFRHLLELLRLGFYLVLETCALDPNVRYVQVYAGFETLALEAERIKMRFPLSKATIARYIPAATTVSMTRPAATFWTEPADMRKYPEAATDKRSAIFKLELISDFLGGDYNTIGLEKVKENFFSPSQRNMLFYSIMSRCKVTIEGHHLKKLSVKQLIHHHYYKDVYTPHSGLIDFSSTSNYFSNDLRAKLVAWAKRYSRDPVPLTNIRLYFGENVAFFFAWLDFYTAWFQSAMIFGFLALIWGAISYYQKVKTSSSLASLEWINLIDNEATPVFALCLSVWALVFLKFWKRRAHYLSFIWDMDDYSSTIEAVRIEWRPSQIRNSQISSGSEAYVPASVRRSKRFFGKILMFGAFLLLVGFVSLNVYGSVKIINVQNYVQEIQNPKIREYYSNYAQYAGAALSAGFTVMQIFILTPIYWSFILWLSNFENYRLSTNYQNALIWKLFILNFVNCYGLVFFAGLVAPIWSTLTNNDFTIFGEASSCTSVEGVPTCLVSLVTNIAIVFVGTQFVQQLWAILYPMFIAKTARTTSSHSGRKHIPTFMVESEYLTMTPDLFQNEYTSKVTILGYVLLFSAPFPVAPLLSFLNNLVELRANLYKRIVFYKRNFAEGANSIGSWSEITTLIVYAGIITNGFMIAFTNHGPEILLETYYPGAVEEYNRQRLFYKLVIVLIYEHFIFVVSYILEVSIPDVPAAVRTGRIAEQFIRAERETIDVPVEDGGNEFDELFYEEGDEANFPAASPDQLIQIY